MGQNYRGSLALTAVRAALQHPLAIGRPGIRRAALSMDAALWSSVLAAAGFRLWVAAMLSCVARQEVPGWLVLNGLGLLMWGRGRLLMDRVVREAGDTRWLHLNDQGQGISTTGTVVCRTDEASGITVFCDHALTRLVISGNDAVADIEAAVGHAREISRNIAALSHEKPVRLLDACVVTDGVSARVGLHLLPVWRHLAVVPKDSPAANIAARLLIYRAGLPSGKRSHAYRTPDALIPDPIAGLPVTVASGLAALDFARRRGIDAPIQDATRRQLGKRTEGREVPIAGLIHALLKAGFDDIRAAEIALAISGRKASRICCSDKEATQLSALIGSSAGLCFSPYRLIPAADARIANFSNMASKVAQLLPGFIQHGDCVAYLAATPAQARAALRADRREAAGRLFAIPRCCEKAFMQRWRVAADRWSGDMASMTFFGRDKNGHVRAMPWQLNVFAMYFGGGLLWHFPCSVECRQTIKLIEERVRVLRRISPKLTGRLLRGHRRPIMRARNGHLRQLQRLGSGLRNEGLGTVLIWH